MTENEYYEILNEKWKNLTRDELQEKYNNAIKTLHNLYPSFDTNNVIKLIWSIQWAHNKLNFGITVEEWLEKYRRVK